MSFQLEIEAWFEHTDFDVVAPLISSGSEFHIDVNVRTEFRGEHNIKLQLNETNARALRDDLTEALKKCYYEHERVHSEEPPLVDRSPQKADGLVQRNPGPGPGTSCRMLPWHQEAHSLGSTCPSCGGSHWDTEEADIACSTPSCGNARAPGGGYCRICIADAEARRAPPADGLPQCFRHPEFGAGDCPLCDVGEPPSDGDTAPDVPF